jgi:hypothetical protein
VRVFKTKRFAQFARRERITDRSLCEAVQRAERGLIDADLAIVRAITEGKVVEVPYGKEEG